MKATFPIVVSLVVSIAVLASAQEVDTNEASGSNEVDRAAQRARHQAVVSAHARAIADHEAAYAEVKDIEGFIKVAHADRQQRVQRYYALREQERSSKYVRSRERHQKIQAWNNYILSINDPLKPYVPGIAAKNVITVDARDASIRDLRVLQVIDQQNALMELRNAQLGSTDREFWLTGTDTTGWADDERSTLTGLFLAVGSRTFATADGGFRTVPQMKRFDLKPHEDSLTRRAEVRTWTLIDGTTVEGILLLCDSGRVLIGDLDGKETILKLSELSEADWDYVRLHAPIPKRRAPRQQAGPAEAGVEIE